MFRHFSEFIEDNDGVTLTYSGNLDKLSNSRDKLICRYETF